jgi:putative transposase
MLRLVPRHEFETLARAHHRGQRLRRFSRWGQWVAMLTAQLTRRASLRDVVAALASQAHKLYHAGVRRVTRSTLARVNAEQPSAFYEELFARLLARAQAFAPRHPFRFRNKLYSLDATVIDLCLSVFPWATFRATKGAVKLHVGLDHGGYVPAFAAVREGREHEMRWARELTLPKGSVLVFDKGFTDYAWFEALTKRGVFFVTRLKRNARAARVRRHAPASGRDGGVTSDTVVRLPVGQGRGARTLELRRVGFRDAKTGKRYAFLTNAFHLSARTVAAVYKERWQIELFFKWIKQNLKIKAFLGASRNAVMTQIWVALCAALLLAWMKFQNGLALSLQQMLRLLHVNLFERRDLMTLLRGAPPPDPARHVQPSLLFT